MSESYLCCWVTVDGHKEWMPTAAHADAYRFAVTSYPSTSLSIIQATLSPYPPLDRLFTHALPLPIDTRTCERKLLS